MNKRNKKPTKVKKSKKLKESRPTKKKCRAKQNKLHTNTTNSNRPIVFGQILGKIRKRLQCPIRVFFSTFCVCLCVCGTCGWKKTGFFSEATKKKLFIHSSI